MRPKQKPAPRGSQGRSDHGRRARLPSLPGADSRLARLTETAKAYARAARSENTARAYELGLAAIRLLAPPQRF